MRRQPTLAAFLLLMGLANWACSSPERAKQKYFESANHYFEQKKYKEAIVEYGNALKQDPKFGEARYRLAEAYAETGDVSRAYGEYIRAADLLPGNAEAQLKAGTFLLMAGQFEDAKTRARGILATDPRNAKAQILLGNALAGLKDFDTAVKQMEEAIKIEPNAAGYASLGTIQATRGSQPDAEKAFRNAVAAEPNSVNAHLALGNYLWGAGRVDEAEQSLLRAAELDPKNLLANRGLATLYTYSNRAQKAEPFLKVAAEQDSTPAAAQKLALADYYVAFKRDDEALKVLEPLGAVKESFAASRARIATILYSRKQTDEAHKVIDDVLKKEPGNTLALLTKARFLGAEHKYDQAVEFATSAVTADAQNIQAHYVLGMLRIDRKEPALAISSFNNVLRLNPRAVPAMIQLSRLNLQQGRSSEAVRAAREASTLAPHEPNVQLALAQSLIADGRLEAAVPVVNELLTKYPNESQVYSTAGVLAGLKKDWTAARRAYEKAQQLDPDNFDALSGLVACDLAESKPAVAQARIDKELARTPNRAEIYILSARASENRKDLPKAEDALRQATRVDPNNMGAYTMLGQVLVAQGKLDQARDQFQQVATKEPSVASLTMLATILEVQNKRQEARERYEQILKIDPGAAVAANNLAWIYADTGGNLDVALQLAQTAKARLPRQAEVDDTLGWVYYKKGLYALAVPPLKRAADADLHNPVYQLHLGQAYLKAGDRQQAKTALERALKISDKFDGADEARGALSSLQSGTAK